MEKGTLTKVLPEGPAFVEVHRNGRTMSFPFSLIKGWNGRRPSDLRNFSRRGLAEGVTVKLEIKNGRITKVEPK